ncbi:MAG TPA: hypothetical protein VFY49_15195, partial [Myxococcota bacterium]|nr:hypothetical protein [Myxococcota bacterium]
MIDADVRASMEETLRAALADALAADARADVDALLAQLGWLEMLADEPDDAIAIVFEALGAANATATALDDVLASALGCAPRAGLALLLPRFATWDPAGRIDAGELSAHGLATARAAGADAILVAGGTAAQPFLLEVPASATEVRAVHGIDPAGGLRAVKVKLSAAR